MMSATISPEAERLKETILDIFETSNIEMDVLMEALCATVIEFADAYMESVADQAGSGGRPGSYTRTS